MLSRLECAGKLLYVFIIVMLMDNIGLAQTLYAGPQGQRRSEPRAKMRVIEVTPYQPKLNHFTLLGAVGRSGVFTTNDSKIPLSSLIGAGGGLTEAEKVTLRIIRGGQHRFSFPYDPQSAAEVFVHAGDIVVALPQPGEVMTRTQFPVTPVVCVGLSDRPVVLPLAAEIRTLGDLLYELNQPAAMESTLRLIDPFSRVNTTELAPGSVIFFDTKSVDRAALVHVNSFPPAVPLAPPAKPLSPGANLEQKRSLTGDEVSLLPTDLLEAGQRIFKPQESTPPPELALPLFETAEGPVETGASNSAISRLPGSTGTLNREQGLEVRTDGTRPIPLSNPPEQEHSELERNLLSISHQSVDIPLLTDDSSDQPEMVNGVEGAPLPQIAPAPPEQEAVDGNNVVPISPVSKRNLKASAPSPELHETSVKFNKKRSESSTSDNEGQGVAKGSDRNAVWRIAAMVGLLGLCCFTVAILTSRYERKKKRRSEAVAQRPVAATGSELSGDVHSAHPVAQILSRSIPLIVEDVVLPSHLSMHGRPVGQHRIILHERQPQLNGPHFLSRSPQPRRRKEADRREQFVAEDAAVSNQGLQPGNSRNSTVRDVVSRDVSDHLETSKEQKVVSFVSQPVLPESEAKLDVVGQVGSASPLSSSALERALRILAKEKTT